jgi:hypothetical protein
MYKFNKWLKFREANGEISSVDDDYLSGFEGMSQEEMLEKLRQEQAKMDRMRQKMNLPPLNRDEEQLSSQQEPRRPQGADPKKVQDAYKTLSFSAKNNPRIMAILKNVQADVLDGSLKGPIAQALINAAETNDLNGLIQTAGQGQQQPTPPQQQATGGFKVTTALGIKPDEVEILPFPKQNKTGFRNKRQGSPGFGRVFYIDNGLDQAAKEKFFKDLRTQFGT